MPDLIDTWLRLPSITLAQHEGYGVTFGAAQKCGGVRQGRGGNWILGCWADPPSVFHVVDDDDLVLDDLVAFNPAAPDRFRCIYGSGVAMLGESAFDRARFRPLSNVHGHGLLHIFKNPMAWLRASGAGVCILDPQAFGRAVIGHGIRLIAEDLQHGEQIDRAIRAAVRFAYPEIRVAA